MQKLNMDNNKKKLAMRSKAKFRLEGIPKREQSEMLLSNHTTVVVGDKTLNIKFEQLEPVKTLGKLL